MHYTSLILPTLLASAAATAIPGLSPISVDPLTKRSEKIWDPKGNVRLVFSEETIKVGDLDFDAVFGELAGACHEQGQCDTNEFTMKSILWTKNSRPEYLSTFGPAGTYPTWIRNGLIDVLARAVKQIAKCEDVTYTFQCGGNAMAYCPERKSRHTNCEVPKYWGVNFQSPDVANAAPPSIGLDVASEKISNAEVCKTALETAGTVAGAVNGPAGSMFTLLSMACV